MRNLFVFVALLLVGGVASAQTATVEWTPPTTTVAGGPLTGADALTKFQLWLSNAPIVTLPATPTVEVAPTVTSYVYTGRSGDTLYARMKACNSSGCSEPTVQVQGTIPWPQAVPGIPQNIVIKVKP